MVEARKKVENNIGLASVAGKTVCMKMVEIIIEWNCVRYPSLSHPLTDASLFRDFRSPEATIPSLRPSQTD